MKSAVFVDFDNVFTQLKELQPEAAERFARQPQAWVEWLIESCAMPNPHAVDAVRRILVRRCYLNPVCYATYRSAFLRAGFDVVDCPPLTHQGKTGADIYMALDIVDVLQQETRIDEFIVISADADFTPVLRKIRRFDRRTTVLAVGQSSAAYRSSADTLIADRMFIANALGLPNKPAPVAEHIGVVPIHTPAINVSDDAVMSMADTPRPITNEERTQIIAVIESLVAASAVPISAAALAAKLRSRFPTPLQDWSGHVSFRAFFESLGLNRFAWLQGSGGQIMDTERTLRTGSQVGRPHAASMWRGYEDLVDLAQVVCHRTGAPPWAPPLVSKVIEAICDDVAVTPFDLDGTASRVSEACCAVVPGSNVSASQVSFVLRGVQLNGHTFFRGRDNPTALAHRLSNQVTFLCRRNKMNLDESSNQQIRRWLGGGDLGCNLFTESATPPIRSHTSVAIDSCGVCDIEESICT